MNGVALIENEMPVAMLERHRLQRRLYARGAGDREFRFLWNDREPLLPVWWEGQFQLVQWGNTDRQSPLPRTGWTWKQSIDDGLWAFAGTEPVTIMASLVVANGVWYPIRQGIRGILARDGRGIPHVYVVCKEPSRYYRVMTRADRQPLLVEEDDI